MNAQSGLDFSYPGSSDGQNDNSVGNGSDVQASPGVSTTQTVSGATSSTGTVMSNSSIPKETSGDAQVAVPSSPTSTPTPTSTPITTPTSTPITTPTSITTPTPTPTSTPITTPTPTPISTPNPNHTSTPTVSASKQVSTLGSSQMLSPASSSSSQNQESIMSSGNGVSQIQGQFSTSAKDTQEDQVKQNQPTGGSSQNHEVESKRQGKSKGLDSLLNRLKKFKEDSIDEAVSTVSEVPDQSVVPSAKNKLGLGGSNTSSAVAKQMKSPSVPIQTSKRVQSKSNSVKKSSSSPSSSSPPSSPSLSLSSSPSSSSSSSPSSPSSPSSVSKSVSVKNLKTNNVQVKDEQVGGKQVKGKYKYSIEQLLDLVIERDASDLHLSINYPAIIREDGELIHIVDDVITEEQIEGLILPLLEEDKRDRLEVNREVDFAYDHHGKGRFRVNAFYQKGTMAAALRLIPARIRTMEELGLPVSYQRLAKLRQGFVLVTGPTGSGKSTTLAAVLQQINVNRTCHILTIEDPIEYVYPFGKALIAQRELGEDTHSWEIAMKSALREDPDVILVGEMRDYETIGAAITLAETGHLVLATLHTNSATQTIDRIIDVFPEHQQNQVRSQLSNIIEAVIAQRLIPVKGGGRRAVSEVMFANSAVRNLIREGKAYQLNNVISTSADVGMISLENSLVKLVREGAITMEMAQRYAVYPEEVVRLMKG